MVNGKKHSMQSVSKGEKGVKNWELEGVECPTPFLWALGGPSVAGSSGGGGVWGYAKFLVFQCGSLRSPVDCLSLASSLLALR